MDFRHFRADDAEAVGHLRASGGEAEVISSPFWSSVESRHGRCAPARRQDARRSPRGGPAGLRHGWHRIVDAVAGRLDPVGEVAAVQSEGFVHADAVSSILRTSSPPRLENSRTIFSPVSRKALVISAARAEMSSAKREPLASSASMTAVRLISTFVATSSLQREMSTATSVEEESRLARHLVGAGLHGRGQGVGGTAQIAVQRFAQGFEAGDQLIAAGERFSASVVAGEGQASVISALRWPSTSFTRSSAADTLSCTRSAA